MKPTPAFRTGFTPQRLRLLLVVLFFILVIPTAVLIFKARQQIKWEALYQHRVQAEELTRRIDQNIANLVAQEEARPTTDYQFLVVAGQSATGFLQRSPLSEWPVSNAPPGLLGYFQVDAAGQLQTPLLPQNENANRWGLNPDDIRQRNQRIAEIHGILNSNQLVQRTKKPAPAIANAATADAANARTGNEYSVQENFDLVGQLQDSISSKQSLGKVAELQLEKGLLKEETKMAAPASSKLKPAAAPAEKRAARKEQNALAETLVDKLDYAAAGAAVTTPVRLFESEVDPFELQRLDSGHLLFFRKVWRNGERLVQGFILDQAVFFQRTVGDAFEAGTLAQASNLIVAYKGDVIRIFSAASPDRYVRTRFISASDVRGTLLLQQRLSAPLSDLQLIFSVTRLPDGPGGVVISWISAALVVLLMLVFGVMYRLGIKQLRLAQQQQNFIASVSHELKTPLTSIRMFGEILREGWASAEKKQEYYDYICDESERLSRLIANVLQLARMERQELQLDLKSVTLATLCDLVRSRIGSQIERTAFTLTFKTADDIDNVHLQTDADALIQILLNLVDNAMKFSAQADKKEIVLTILHDNKHATFSVRDFGPGIPAGQQQKIFGLFYRVGNELTRETQGTGIGLALVQQLARAMTGNIEVQNRQPGAEFKLTLPLLPR